MGSQRLGVLHWRCWRSLPAACLPVCVPKSTASLSGLGSPGISPPHDGIWDIPGIQNYSPAAEVWHRLFQTIFLVCMGTGNICSVKLLISFPGTVCPEFLRLFFKKMVFFEMWQRLWLSKRWKSLPFSEHFACICCVQIFFVCVCAQGHQGRKKTQDNRVGKDVGNERGVLRGGRGDPDRCRLGWWGWR